MEGTTTVLLLGALFSPLVALVGAIVVYLNHRAMPGGKRRSVVLFSSGAIFVGVDGGWIGAMVGIAIFCSIYGGAQCGFGGVFFSGPLSFSLTVAAFLYFWVKRGKAP